MCSHYEPPEENRKKTILLLHLLLLLFILPVCVLSFLGLKDAVLLFLSTVLHFDSCCVALFSVHVVVPAKLHLKIEGCSSLYCVCQ